MKPAENYIAQIYFSINLERKNQEITWPSLQLYYICYHLLNGLILSPFASKIMLTEDPFIISFIRKY